MKKMIVLMIGLGVILGGCRKKEKQEAASGPSGPGDFSEQDLPNTMSCIRISIRLIWKPCKR